MKIQVNKQIDDIIINKLHEALKLEYESGMLYEGMACWLDHMGLIKTSLFFRIHGVEERRHGSWVIDYLQDMNVLVKMPTINSPEYKWNNLEDILKETYAHEEMITKTWSNISTLALKHADHMTYRFTQKLLDEQREELELFSNLINVYNLVADKPNLENLFESKISHPAIQEEAWLENAEG